MTRNTLDKRYYPATPPPEGEIVGIAQVQDDGTYGTPRKGFYDDGKLLWQQYRGRRWKWEPVPAGYDYLWIPLGRRDVVDTADIATVDGP